jgi:hypothetical protein
LLEKENTVKKNKKKGMKPIMRLWEAKRREKERKEMKRKERRDKRKQDSAYPFD